MENFKIDSFVLGGGVSANILFRQILINKGINIIVGSPIFSTDNSAMIAAAGVLSDNLTYVFS